MLQSSIKQFTYYKQLADKAMRQLSSDEMYFNALHIEDNSIEIIIRHMSGNMKSRWSNIFEEDGEKSWRNRDAEFETTRSSVSDLLDLWEQGWKILFDTLSELDERQLDTIIYIRNEGLTLSDAIIRQLCHYSYHCGQIVTKCKQQVGADWKSLSIPRNGSVSYNQNKFNQEKRQIHFLDNMPDEN